MITTLNPKVTNILMAISLIISFYASYQNKFAVVAFLIGNAVTFPIIIRVWNTVEKNWKSLYKKFYSKTFHKRDKALVKKSFRLTWWVIPWCLAIYSTISFAIIKFDKSFNLLLAFIFGSIFLISLVTNQKSRKYYEEIK